MNLATVLAVLLSAGMTVLWGRSYRASETVEWTQEWIKHGVSVSRGTVRYHKYQRSTLPFTDFYSRGLGRRTGYPTAYEQSYPRDAVYWDRGGFRFVASSPETARVLGKFAFFDVPCWALLVIFALLPVDRLIRAAVRRHRRSRARCATCGYDLRATPDRCPECGAPANSPHNQPIHRTVPAV